MNNPLLGAELTETQFAKISDLVRRLCGINLHSGKQQLVKARLSKRLRVLGLRDFGEYLHLLESETSGNELVTMLDALSTNLTSFFREAVHFDFVRQEVLPELLQASGSRRLRIWSAGCSSGEEPYTLGITLLEAIPNPALWDVKILATDLSTEVLSRAARGIYPPERLKDVPRTVVKQYFQTIKDPGDGTEAFRVRAPLRNLITFARLNLMEKWPMKGPFQVIFCRNVMIYFEKPIQEALVNRYYEMLAPGGYLFLGHSESLTGTKNSFTYLQPTIYRK